MSDFTERDLAALLLLKSGNAWALAACHAKRLLGFKVAHYQPADVPSGDLTLTPLGDRVVAEALAAAKEQL